MKYRYNLSKNPRIFILFTAAALLPLAGFSLVLAAGPVFGVIAGVAGLLFAYPLIKYAIAAVQSYIHIHDDGLTVHMPDGDILRFSWEEISHSGTVVFPDGRERAFVYAEHKDQFIEIAPLYKDYQHFLKEMKERTAFSAHKAEDASDMKDFLSRLLENDQI
ncbi:MAG: hypothetical protein JXB03_13110 [Spirochaetales bacterium]|nr:hypothetical protein [Spirochaetales bacterium]